MTPGFRTSMIAALGFFVLAGAEFLKGNASADLPPGVTAEGELGAGVDYWATRGASSEHVAKIALGNNADAVLSLDLIADGGAGNQRDDGVTTGNVSGRGTRIALEIFAAGVTTSLRGVILRFDFDASLLSFVKAENSAFPLSIPEGSIGVNLAATSPVALARSGFLARAEFETVADVTGSKFSVGIESVTLAESPTMSDILRTGSEITFNTVSSPDFDGDGNVGFSDFLILASVFGSRLGDGRYNAAQDLNSDGSIDFTDFLIFAGAFGSQVPPNGGGGTPAGSAPADRTAFDRLAVGKRILAKTFFLDIVSAGRFAESFRRYEGRYTYTNTGPNTGNITQIYDDSELFGGRCITEMRFTTATSGTLRFMCDNGNEGDVEPWRTTDLSAPILARATPDTLYFELLDTWRAGETRAYDFQLRTKTPQGVWNEFCQTFTNPTGNTLSVYASVWFFGSDLESGATYEMRYRYRNSSSCQTGSPGQWSPIVEGATVAGGQGNGGTGRPDLVVDAPTVSNSRPTAGASFTFTLSATVRNQGTGQSAATTLRFYRSTDATISDSDTEVGSDAVGVLSASGTSGNSIELTAPSSAGTYYYGACVESVSDESDTGNNCSPAVTVIVTVPHVWKMYWTQAGRDRIWRSNLDGSDVEDLVVAVSGRARGIALDVSGGKIYWTVSTDLSRLRGKIRRSNLDGSGVEDLVTGLSHPHGVALDVSGGKMYWTDERTEMIQRSDLDGRSIEDLVTTGLERPGGIALDVAGGKMYWTDGMTDKIQRSNLNGSGVEDLVTTGLSYPYGIALDVSGGKMYWADYHTHKIQRSNLDGSGVEDLVTGLNYPVGIALDVAGGKMYWTDSTRAKIQRSNLDGSGVEDLVTSQKGATSGIALGLVPVEEGTD